MLLDLEPILLEMKKTNQFLEKIEEHLRVPDMVEWAKAKKASKLKVL